MQLEGRRAGEQQHEPYPQLRQEQEKADKKRVWREEDARNRMEEAARPKKKNARPEEKNAQRKRKEEEKDDEPKQKEEARSQRDQKGQKREDERKREDEAERHQKRQKEKEEEQKQKENQEGAERQQKKRREEERQAVDWKKKAEELAAERLGRPTPPRQAARPTMSRKPPPPEGFQPVVATVTTEDYLRQKNFATGRLDVDDDGWYPLHHAILDTLGQAGLLDVVLELARAMPVEAFDRLANNP